MRNVISGIKQRLRPFDAVIYAAAAVTVILIKILYRNAENHADLPGLLLFLKPLSAAAGLFFGLSFEFDASRGFYNSEAGIAIGTSCAGINFFIIVFCMLVFTFTSAFKNSREKAAAFFIFLGAAYIFSILANISRVIVSIYILTAHLPLGGLDGGLVHQFAGILTYLAYLVIGFQIAKITRSLMSSASLKRAAVRKFSTTESFLLVRYNHEESENGK